MKTRVTLCAAMSVLLLSAPAQALTPAEKCEVGKNSVAASHAKCHQKAYAKYALTGDAARRDEQIAKCQAKLEKRWDKLEDKALLSGSSCPSTGDLAAIDGVIAAHAREIADALSGVGFPQCTTDRLECLDAVAELDARNAAAREDLLARRAAYAELVQRQAELEAESLALQTENVFLQGVAFETAAEQAALEDAVDVCQVELAVCEADLAQCQAAP